MINPDIFGGMKIIENHHLMVFGEPVQIKRGIKERLFSWPWNPFKSTKTFIPLVPSREVIYSGGFYIMHPNTKKQLINTMSKSGQTT